MRAEHVFITLGALVLGFFLCAAGIFLLVFPYVVLNLRVVSIVSIAAGLFFLIFFSLTSRRRYLLVKMGGFEMREKLVRHYIKQELESFFPDEAVSCNVIVRRKGKLEILANIPYLLEEKRELVLKQIETKLAATLLKYCGFERSFIFNVNFSSKRK